jgi:hypothetical protein
VLVLSAAVCQFSKSLPLVLAVTLVLVQAQEPVLAVTLAQERVMEQEMVLPVKGLTRVQVLEMQVLVQVLVLAMRVLVQVPVLEMVEELPATAVVRQLVAMVAALLLMMTTTRPRASKSQESRVFEDRKVERGCRARRGGTKRCGDGFLFSLYIYQSISQRNQPVVTKTFCMCLPLSSPQSCSAETSLLLQAD